MRCAHAIFKCLSWCWCCCFLCCSRCCLPLNRVCIRAWKWSWVSSHHTHSLFPRPSEEASIHHGKIFFIAHPHDGSFSAATAMAAKWNYSLHRIEPWTFLNFNLYFYMPFLIAQTYANCRANDIKLDRYNIKMKKQRNKYNHIIWIHATISHICINIVAQLDAGYYVCIALPFLVHRP